jgi:uncharacterized membrane protein
MLFMAAVMVLTNAKRKTLTGTSIICNGLTLAAFHVPTQVTVSICHQTMQAAYSNFKNARAHNARDIGLFSTVLRELIYAYMICQLNISFAVTFLAHFADAPALEQYQVLKVICRYLQSMKG